MAEPHDPLESHPDVQEPAAMDQEPDDNFPQEADTCRICRSEATPEEPLFYPCKCSGSIKHVHQECLMEWLSHTNKKHCELCKTPFRFTKLYDADMPDALPWHIFAAQALLHLLWTVLSWLRAVLVAVIWLLMLPWFIRWSWRIVFYMLDAGWAREPWLENLVATQGNSTLLPGRLRRMLGEDTARQIQNATHPNHNVTDWSAFDAGIDKDLPVFAHIFSLFVELLVHPSRTLPRPLLYTDSVLLNDSHAAATSTLLSDFDFAKTITSNPSVNRAIIDVLEGQLITIVVVTAFILVFLIREWVIQQQPVINAAADIREAERDLERVEAARQRIRDEIRLVERQLQEFETKAEISEAATSIRTSTSTTRNGVVVHATEVPPNHIDWRNLGERVRVVTEEWANTDHGHNAASRALVATAANQCIDMVLRFDQDHVSDLDGLGPLLEWVRDIPPDTDSVWLSDVAAELSRLLHAARFVGRPSTTSAAPKGRDVDDADSMAVHNPDDRDSDFSPDEVVHNDNFPRDTNVSLLSSQIDYAPLSDSTTSSASRQDSSQSTDSWQAVPSTPPSPSAVADADMDEAQNIPDDATLPTSSPERTPSEQLADELHALAEDNPAEDATDAVRPPAPRPQAFLQRVYNFFWGDLDLTIPADDAPEVEGPDLDPARRVRFAPLPADDVNADLPPVMDPEVLAAAAEAGLDADAVEEAEDMEGILELIGMQGPIITLFQTAFICGGLITFTLWTAVGGPYAFGKTMLMVWADPWGVLVVHPVMLGSLIADVTVDLATMLVGGIGFKALQMLALGINIARIRAVLMPLPKFVERGAITSKVAADRAFGHLGELIAGPDGSRTWRSDSPLLGASMQAHFTLVEIKGVVKGWFATVVKVAMELLGYSAADGRSRLRLVQTFASHIWTDVKTDVFHAKDMATRALTADFFPFAPYKERTYDAIDPLLAYWNGTDRFFTILIGYCTLTAIGAAYLLRTEPFFAHSALQKVERALADILKQAGGIIKVVLIISIEMLLFPLYCGVLLDIALLPLFDGVTLESRMLYASTRPYMFTFLHWFLGTAYMFNFALFVGMCRRLLRSGVLYFIRDPDDPTFHPVRDVLERSITTQLRKIAFSALVYGLMVIFCMGGVVWSIAHLVPGVFPLRWSTPDPALEFPVEFVLYNFISPLLFKYLQPTLGTEALYDWWLRKCARALRLSHFLFGERKEDEEAKDDPSRGGSYVKAPASDQVRIVKGQPVFEPAREEDVIRDEKSKECPQHGRPGQKFRSLYIPPWFRVRIMLFLAGLWWLSAGIGVGLTVIPLVLGRGMCYLVLPKGLFVSDIWAITLGLHTLLFASFALFRLPKLSSAVGDKVRGVSHSAVSRKIRHIVSCTLRCAYVYGFIFVAMPVLAGLLFQLYIIVPVRTYAETPRLDHNTTSANPTFLFSPTKLFDQASSPSTVPKQHNIYAFPEWTLGLLLSRLMTMLLSYRDYPLPRAIKRSLTRAGRLNPDAWLATRAIVLPTTLLGTLAFFAPAAFAALGVKVLGPLLFGIHLAAAESVRVYRYTYPLFLAQVLALWAALGARKALGRWRSIIKDEVYLVGERLHNFGETRPPRGSRGVMKRGMDGRETVGGRDDE